MSRTKRTHLEWRYHVAGHFYNWKEFSGSGPQGRAGIRGEYYVDRQARDKKPWNKPDRAFKRIYRQRERAQVKHALQNGQDVPVFPKTDQWNWT